MKIDNFYHWFMGQLFIKLMVCSEKFSRWCYFKFVQHRFVSSRTEDEKTKLLDEYAEKFPIESRI